MAQESSNKGLDVYALIAEHKSGKYSVEERLNAAMLYVCEKSLKEVHRKTGIPYMTLIDWKRLTEWWAPVVQECRRRKQDELDSTMTHMIDNAINGILDRIANGDVKLDKMGNQIRVPMSGKELAWVTGVMFDKRASLRGDPITHSRNVSSAESLQQLKDQFKTFVNQMEQAGALAKPLEGNAVEEEPEN